MNNKGFSLIEMMIAVAVMAILTGMLVPQYMRYIEKSREARDRQVLDTVYEAIQMAMTDETAYGDLTANTGEGEIYGGIDSEGIRFSKLREASENGSHPFASEVMSVFGTKTSAALLSKKAGGNEAEPVILIAWENKGQNVSVSVVSVKNRSMGVGDGIE